LPSTRYGSTQGRQVKAAGLLADETGELPAIGDEAVEQNDAGAAGERLLLVGRGRIRGHDDRRAHPRGRRVGRERATGIAGRRSHEVCRAKLGRAAHRDRHASRLERPRRVHALRLDVQPGQPKLSCQPGGRQKRRGPLAERGDERSHPNGQQLLPAPESSAAPGEDLFGQPAPKSIEVIARQKRAAVGRVDAVQCVCVVADS